jgi:hypothetical protein
MFLMNLKCHLNLMFLMNHLYLKNRLNPMFLMNLKFR